MRDVRGRAGDTLESIAARFATTVDRIVDLNYNIISHISNPERVHDGDRLCLVPDFAKHKVYFSPWPALMRRV